MRVRPRFRCACAALCVLAAPAAPPPVPAASILDEYELPPFDRAPLNSPQRRAVDDSQCMRRLSASGLSFDLVSDPYTFADRLESEIRERVAREFQWTDADTNAVRRFTGTTASALNAFLSPLRGDVRVRVEVPCLLLDEPVRLASRLDLQGMPTAVSNAAGASAAFVARDAERVSLGGFRVRGADVAVHAEAVRFFRFRDLALRNNRRGILLRGACEFGTLENVEAAGNLFGGVTLVGPVQRVLVARSTLSDGGNYFNWHAGLVATDTPLSAWPTNEHEFAVAAVRTSILDAAAGSPRLNLFRHVLFSGNTASGAYLDGAIACVARDCLFENNDKEGLCLDGGSALNAVLDSVVRENGWRRRQTDEHLRGDFVLRSGRLYDGSSVAKLPGISLDNAACNLLLGNTISHNAGDGVKFVRAGFRNLVMFNSILENNRGQNSTYRFFGVLLGNAPPDAHTEAGLYDFLPSIENIVAGNIIYGRHSSGVLLDKGAAFNDIYNNVIFKFRKMPVESASTNFNSVVENAVPGILQPAQVRKAVEDARQEALAAHPGSRLFRVLRRIASRPGAALLAGAILAVAAAVAFARARKRRKGPDGPPPGARPDPPAGQGGRHGGRTIAAASLSLAVLALAYLGDVVAGYRRLRAQEEPPNPIHEPCDLVGWRPKPNLCVPWNYGKICTTDAFGFRKTGDGRDAPVNLFLFGDSFTFGQGVADDETFAGVLARDHFKGNVQVHNGGVMGYGIANMLQRLRANLDRVHTNDVVLFTPLAGDLLRNMDDFLFFSQLIFRRRNMIRFVPDFNDGAVRLVPLITVGNRIKALMFNAPLTGRFAHRFYRTRVNRTDTLQEARDMIAQARAATERRGATFALVFLPTTLEIQLGRYFVDVSGFDHTDIRASFPTACEQLQKLVCTREDLHWNAEGHALAAKAIAEVVARQRLLPATASTAGRHLE